MEVVKKIKKRRPFTPTVKIAVGYLVLIALGAAILLLPFATWENKSIGFTTALFTSTSAVCVTGLTVVDTFIYQYVDRIQCWKNGTKPSGSSAQAYAWLIWDKNNSNKEPVFRWIRRNERY